MSSRAMPRMWDMTERNERSGPRRSTDAFKTHGREIQVGRDQLRKRQPHRADSARFLINAVLVSSKYDGCVAYLVPQRSTSTASRVPSAMAF